MCIKTKSKAGGARAAGGLRRSPNIAVGAGPYDIRSRVRVQRNFP